LSTAQRADDNDTRQEGHKPTYTKTHVV